MKPVLNEILYTNEMVFMLIKSSMKKLSDDKKNNTLLATTEGRHEAQT